MLNIYVLKELRSLFRDRNVLTYGLLLPLFLYPTLLFGISQIRLYIQGLGEASRPRVAIVGSPKLTKHFLTMPGRKFDIVPIKTDDREPLVTGAVDLIIKPSDDERRYQIFYASERPMSTLANDVLKPALMSYRHDVEIAAGTAVGVSRRALAGITIKAIDVVDPSKTARSLLSLLLPLVMMVMCTFGATYPAVELTAGERERHCAETTILLPLSRVQIAVGKTIAVTIAAFLALVINLIATVMTASPILSSWSTGVAALPSFPLYTIPTVLGFGLLLSILYANVFLLVASRARNYREAQAFITPVQILVLVPGMISMIPGAEFTTRAALIPFYNIGLAFRGALLGNLQMVPMIYCLMSLAIVTLVCFHFTLRRLSGTAPVLGYEDPDQFQEQCP